MAKPRGLPPAAAVLRLADDQRRLAVRVVPNAAADSIILPENNDCLTLQIRLTQIAEDGKANAAMLALLSKTLGVPKSSLTIIQGSSSRTKVIQLPSFLPLQTIAD
jgi:uncharacterized protein